MLLAAGRNGMRPWVDVGSATVVWPQSRCPPAWSAFVCPGKTQRGPSGPCVCSEHEFCMARFILPCYFVGFFLFLFLFLLGSLLAHKQPSSGVPKRSCAAPCASPRLAWCWDAGRAVPGAATVCTADVNRGCPAGWKGPPPPMYCGGLEVPLK